MKKNFIFLLLCTLLGAWSTTANAVVYYNILIAGHSVTDANKDDILGDGVFSYNPETKTLSIKKGGIVTTAFYEHKPAVHSTIDGLTIDVTGNIKLWCPEEMSCFELLANPTIKGKGTLELSGARSSSYSIELKKGCVVTLDHIVVKSEFGLGGCCGDEGSTLVLNGSAFIISNVKETGSAIRGLTTLTLNGCQIIEPVDAHYDTEKKCVVDASGNNLRDMTIVADDDLYDLWIGGKRVHRFYKDNSKGAHWRYDPERNTLSLEGGTITGVGSEASTGYGAGIYSKIPGMVIRVSYNNTVTHSSDARCNGAIELDGTGTTTITGYNSSQLNVIATTTSNNADGCDGIYVNRDTLILDDAIVVADAARYGIRGYVGYRWTYYATLVIKGPATLKAKGAKASVANLKTLDLQNGNTITDPEGAIWNGHYVSDAAGNEIKDWVRIGKYQSYNLWVGGTRVTERNQADILGDGNFSYDVRKDVLTVNGNLKTDDQHGIVSQINGLTIYVVKDATIETSGDDCSAIRLLSNATISGPGLLTLRSQNGFGICALNQVRITLNEANVDVEGTCGIAGRNQSSRESLHIINSTVKAVATSSDVSAICFLLGGITFDGCEVTVPEGGQVKNDRIVDKDGISAKEVQIGIRNYARADVNRDGAIDSADIVAVIKEMPDGDMKADVNNDGAIDSADIVAVIKAMK